MKNPMFREVQQETMWMGKTLRLETGKIGRNTPGCVMVSHGDTRILCAIAFGPAKDLHNFLPLSVCYQERFFAATRFPGGFMKREGKPSDREVTIGRSIDRALRPLFTHNPLLDIQITCTVLSFDAETDCASLSILGAGAAAMLSGLPFRGPIAAARIHCQQDVIKALASPETAAKVATVFQVNYAPSKKITAALDMTLACDAQGIVMLEGHGHEVAQDILCHALSHAQKDLEALRSFVATFVTTAKAEKASQGQVYASHSRIFPTPEHETLKKAIATQAMEIFSQACKTSCEQERHAHLSHGKHAMCTLFGDKASYEIVSYLFDDLWQEYLQRFILAHGRLDGRSVTEIRPIFCQSALLPKSHGSALFTRGHTQALVSLTLGGKEDCQSIDTIQGFSRENFLFHYNFPPFAVGEVGRMSGPGRREIGHGKLAWRALHTLLPKTMPSTVRVVSEITESCGSSSMASVCGASLAFSNASMPLVRPVAGIAMGLLHGENRVMILSDISGLEDGIGHMDCKIAATRQGITAIQMDINGTSLPISLLQQVFSQGKEGIDKILDIMETQCGQVQARCSGAPLVLTASMAPDRIRDLIGPGGRTIREISESTSCKIDIANDGVISIFAPSESFGQDALARLKPFLSTATASASVSASDATTVIAPDIKTKALIPGRIYEGEVTAVHASGISLEVEGKRGHVGVEEISQEMALDIHTIVPPKSRVRVRYLGEQDGQFNFSIKQV